MSERCETCRYWEHETDMFNDIYTSPGQCRRYPGNVVCKRSHWCGEYQPKDSEVTKDE